MPSRRRDSAEHCTYLKHCIIGVTGEWVKRPTRGEVTEVIVYKYVTSFRRVALGGSDRPRGVSAERGSSRRAVGRAGSWYRRVIRLQIFSQPTRYFC